MVELRVAFKLCFFAMVGVFAGLFAKGETLVWAHIGSDMNAAANYVPQKTPADGDIIMIPRTAENPVAPQLTGNISVKAVCFGRAEEEVGALCTNMTLSAVNGSTLTLSASGSYALAVYGPGRITIAAPVVLAGAKAQVCTASAEVDFAANLSTADSFTQEVRLECVKSNPVGSICFSAANAGFRPESIYLPGIERFHIVHPAAIAEVATIKADNWAKGNKAYVYNDTGGEIVLDKLMSFTSGQSNYGHDGLYFEGAPFVMSNCVFSVSMRESKPRYANAKVVVKRTLALGDNDKAFCKDGTNIWVSLEAMEESGSITNNLMVQNGLYYCPKGLPADRRIMLYNDGWYPVLGLNADRDFEMGYRYGAISFGRGGDGKNGGFASMAGDVRVRLYNDSDRGELPVLTNFNWKTEESTSWCKTPNYWIFGHAEATGTVILENDLVIKDEYDVFAFSGRYHEVAGRLTGKVSAALNGSNKRLDKKGNGGLAIDGELDVSEFRIYEGVLFVNSAAVNTQFKLLAESVALGGTGVVSKVDMGSSASGAFRAGEYGRGALTFDPSLANKDFTLSSGRGLIVDISAKGEVGCLKLAGNRNFTAAGGNFIRIAVDPRFNGYARGIFLDIAGATGDAASMVDLDNYKIEFETGSSLDKYSIVKTDDGKALKIYGRRGVHGLRCILR